VQREGNKIALICTMRAIYVSFGGYRRVGIYSRSARLSSSRYTLPELAPSSVNKISGDPELAGVVTNTNLST